MNMEKVYDTARVFLIIFIHHRNGSDDKKDNKETLNTFCIMWQYVIYCS